MRCYLLVVVCWYLFVGDCCYLKMCVVARRCYSLFVVCSLLFAYCLLVVVRCPLFVVCGLLLNVVVCCLLSVGCVCS